MIAVFVSIMRRWTAAKRPPTTDTPHSGPAFSISASRATSTSLLLGCAFCFLCIISRNPRNTISAPRGCGSPIVPIIALYIFSLSSYFILSLIAARQPAGVQVSFLRRWRFAACCPERQTVFHRPGAWHPGHSRPCSARSWHGSPRGGQCSPDNFVSLVQPPFFGGASRC